MAYDDMRMEPESELKWELKMESTDKLLDEDEVVMNMVLEQPHNIDEDYWVESNIKQVKQKDIPSQMMVASGRNINGNIGTN